MNKITVLLSMLFLPLTSLGQETPSVLSCAATALPNAVSIVSGNVASENLERELEQELSRRNHVVICFHQQYESPGHGILGLVDWDERKIAQIEINKLTDGEFAANGIGLTELKAPLGTWHAKRGRSIDRFASGPATGPGVFASVPGALTRREQLMSSRGSCIGYKGGRAGREAVHTLVRECPSRSLARAVIGV